MKHRTASKKTAGKPSVGQEIIASLKEAIAWAGGEDVPVRVATVQVPLIDVRAVRRRLGLSQSAFASKFGSQPATLKNWEQGRLRPDGPARVLLTVMARHPEAVEDALRESRITHRNGPASTASGDRHRGGGHPPTPATPPCVRVRTRRFESVTLTVLEQ